MRQVPLYLTLALVGLWLLLNAELSVLSIASGVLLALLLVLAIARLRPVRPRLRHVHLAIPLLATLLVDIVLSNLAVARVVLGLTRNRQARSGFIDIPLELSDPHGLAVLAVIVTATPGTSWAGVAPDGRVLRLHMLDIRNEDEWIRSFKQRYERRLLRIFQ
ncbi:MAG TPA: Na+/H+ antiporter subunit E [Steroidobacteraceae bacterium]|nr:Na+/H+ antiporter subunit E [Steroidobacteraceae bacterium]